MNQQDFERFLYQVRTWTGISLIFLLTLQVLTGFMITRKIDLLDYQTAYFLHTKGIWITIFFILTHATVNLRFLFRRWWPKYEESLVILLVVGYVLAATYTFYAIFLR